MSVHKYPGSNRARAEVRVASSPGMKIRHVAATAKGRAETGQVGRARWLLRFLVFLGLLAVVYYFSWWWHAGRFAWPWLALALAAAAFYNFTQVLGQWTLYLAAVRRPAPPAPAPRLSVDILVTACKEPLPLVERCLRAALGVRGPHSTWLLDDGNDPALAQLAVSLGAGYLTREGRKDAKAGNLNAALARTHGDIVVIFDIDHAPRPDFLEKSLGYFNDPAVGFVQVMLTFCNERQSWVARAASESALDFYNPTSMGADGLGCATLIGSNALIRRTALESIGGYHPGLAEDLATSIALHAAGWKSVYVPEPLAPGLAPPDLAAWFTQQLKWARGVFEVLLTDYPRLWPRLTWGQRLGYSVRMTYYWIGPVAAVHIFFSLALLLGGTGVARVDFGQYLIHIAPLAVMLVVLRQAALATWRHPSTPQRPLWRATALVYATWPVYTVAWLLAVLRVPVAFRPTPKAIAGGLNPVWLVPQVFAFTCLCAGIALALSGATNSVSFFVPCFAAAQALPQAILVSQWRARERVPEAELLAATAEVDS